MTLAEVRDELGLDVLAGTDHLDHEVAGGYTCDLISDVLANAEAGQLWITIQGHINVVAVGKLRELAGIVVVGGKKPAEDAVAKAEEEGVPILTSEMSAYELSGRLYGLLGG